MPLIDSPIFIDYLRGYPPAVEYLDHALLNSQSHGQERTAGMAVSVVSVLEIYSGARSRLAQKLAKNLLLECTILDLSESIGRRSIVVMERYAPALGLMAPDCLIAATALEYGYPLLTRDLKHFSPIEGLRVEARY